VTGGRRLSQAISEGDGISVIAHVVSLDEAHEAIRQGAEALAVSQAIPGLREATTLPLLWRGDPDWEAARRCGADAGVVYVDQSTDPELEPVAYVSTEDLLETALEQADPEIFLLGLPDAGVEEALDRILDLLPDVPAGKLAIAELPVRTRDEVEELERAGVDAVLVAAGDVALAHLIGDSPPEV
jgi:NAD(P)H-dependent flavin oxidoreductase YrpB (nitropropane dioxygenase family)